MVLTLSRQPAKSAIAHYFHSKELDFDLHQREVVIRRYFVQKGDFCGLFEKSAANDRYAPSSIEKASSPMRRRVPILTQETLDIERIKRRIGLAMPQHIFRLIILLVACAVIGYAAKRGFTVKSFLRIRSLPG